MKIGLIKCSLFFAVLILITSCNNTTTLVNYMKWIENEENGLHQTMGSGHYTIDLQYKPITYVAIQNLGLQNITSEEVNKELQSMEGLQYYTLKIKGNNMELKNMNTEYLAFDMQNSIKLVENSDTLPCVLYHYETTFSITGHHTMVLAFEEKLAIDHEKYANDKLFICHDNELGIGSVRIRIKKRDLNNIPSIKID